MIERWKYMKLKGNAVSLWLPVSRSCWFSQKGQHELPLKMAEVFLGCFVTGQGNGARFWPGCKSWSQIHRVVVSPLGLEIPLQGAEVEVQARAIGFGP